MLGIPFAAASREAKDAAVSSAFRITVSRNLMTMVLDRQLSSPKGCAKEKGVPQGHPEVRVTKLISLPLVLFYACGLVTVRGQAHLPLVSLSMICELSSLRRKFRKFEKSPL